METFKTNLNLKTDEDFVEFLSLSLKEQNFFLTNSQAKKQIEFLKLLVEHNKKTNLTAILNFEDMVYKHILDSLLLLNVLKETKNKTFLDIGAGAGFPSTPIAILEKFKKTVQMDARKKRVDFLQLVKKSLNLNVNPVCQRAEIAAKTSQFREKFNVVVARAVAKLNILCELCIPFVALNGVFVALKGPDYEQDLGFAKDSILKLGAKLLEVKSFKINNEFSRYLIIIKKISHSLTKYPRNFSNILKKPL